MLGRDDGSRLRAVDAMTLLELDNAVLDGIVERYPSVAAILDDVTPGTGGPAAGRKVAPVPFASARIST